MKADMVTLVSQLKEKDESYMKLAQYNQIVDGEIGKKDGEPEMLPVAKMREIKRKNLELQKEVNSKNEKVATYIMLSVSILKMSHKYTDQAVSSHYHQLEGGIHQERGGAGCQ